MYKFKCCTKTENESCTGPLLFSQLETTAIGLINETLELKQEFETKMEFVNEQFLKIYKNEQEIIKIFNLLMSVQEQFSNLDVELKALECLLKETANIVQHLEISSKMETFCLRNICGCNQCRFCCCKTERQHFMELLEVTNHKLEQLPVMVEDMLELRNYGKLKNTFTKICEILNYHCDILRNTEKNIDLLEDKLDFIELQNAQVLAKDKCCTESI